MGTVPMGSMPMSEMQMLGGLGMGFNSFNMQMQM